jgi:hypothetical protein
MCPSDRVGADRVHVELRLLVPKPPHLLELRMGQEIEHGHECDDPTSANPSSRLFGTGSVNERLKRINSCQPMSSPRIPFPFICRTQSRVSAAPTRTFLGRMPGARTSHRVALNRRLPLAIQQTGTAMPRQMRRTQSQ